MPPGLRPQQPPPPRMHAAAHCKEEEATAIKVPSPSPYVSARCTYMYHALCFSVRFLQKVRAPSSYPRVRTLLLLRHLSAVHNTLVPMSVCPSVKCLSVTTSSLASLTRQHRNCLMDQSHGSPPQRRAGRETDRTLCVQLTDHHRPSPPSQTAE